MKKPNYKKAMQQKNRQASNIVPMKPGNEPQPTPRPPVDLSTLPDGEYPFQDGRGKMIKRGNEGLIIQSFQFADSKISHMRLDVATVKLQLGSIITPGPGVPKNIIADPAGPKG